MPAGRPLKFASVEELETKINEYFNDCDTEYDRRKFTHDDPTEDDNGKRVCGNCYKTMRSKGCIHVSGERKVKRPYTVTGLALWLDTTRQTLLDYQHQDAFSDTLIAAKQKIENFASEKLFDPDAPQRGVIFSLSNNSEGWAEKREVTIPKDGASELARRMLGLPPASDPKSDQATAA